MNKAPIQAPAKKSPILPALIIGTLIIAAAISYKTLKPAPKEPPPAQPTATDTSGPIPAARQPAQAAESSQETGAGIESPAATPPPPLPPGAPPEAAPADPKDLVSFLATITGKEPVTPEQAQKWKESLQQLIRQGASSVPAIQQFLTQNLDANFAGVSGAGALGYNSLRSSLLDALAQIGGSESTQAMLNILQTSIFPTDIATLARTLDAQAPGQYQQAILDAARQQLNMAALDQLGGANVLPIFQTLAAQAANGANISADLSQYFEKWPYYSAIALAALPDGAGVQSLIQIAQGTVPGNQAAAAQALAEMASQNTDALNSLLSLAKNGQLSDPILSQLAPFLAGRQYQLGPPQDLASGGYLTFHMAGGNEDFSSFDTGGTLTQSQINQRISIIDQLIQAVPSTDSAAQDALQQQRNSLAGRLKH